MKKRIVKKELAVCCGVGVLAVGICMVLAVGRGAGDGANGEASTGAGTGTGTEAGVETGVGTNTETGMEEGTEPEGTAVDGTDAPIVEEADPVLFLEDEEVRDHPLFHAFINKEVAAYDEALGGERYVQEYLEEYLEENWGMFGIHYMAEDLDGDEEKELLALVQREDTHGDLYVFHESGGRLYAWEPWRDFLAMQMMSIEYHGNGILSKGGGGGCVLGRYNAGGRIEYVVEFYSWAGGYSEYGDMTLYEDGVAVKKYAYDVRDKDPSQVTEEELAARDACAAILDEAYERAGEGRLLHRIYKRMEGVESIPLEELLSTPAGQPSAPQG